MNKTLKGAIVALALLGTVSTGATLISVSPAHAASSVSFDLGNVAFGYNDGYWDHSHQWHKWQNRSHRSAYSKSEGNQYHEWKHNRDSDHGWHDNH